ncbi:Detected protein of confused Function [Hibiscus syriacus]|uniref:Detected protein of confused Function n=1 Tax=Hibiscus syriacus TaxID=106335 RepID=A0A6A3D3J7_HIBSY|nr:Detected protein of confused Function [Hibiscus syriacus]
MVHFKIVPLPNFHTVKAKVRNTLSKNVPTSISGAVVCSQCKGSGVNAVDFFNGEFKAGDSCWLCGGKKQMLCGNCNGAGFIGGFMSTDDQ